MLGAASASTEDPQQDGRPRAADRVVILAAGRYDRSAADVYVLLLDALAVEIRRRRSGPSRRVATSSASHLPTPTSAEALAAAVSAPPPGPRRRR